MSAAEHPTVIADEQNLKAEEPSVDVPEMEHTSETLLSLEEGSVPQLELASGHDHTVTESSESDKPDNSTPDMTEIPADMTQPFPEDPVQFDTAVGQVAENFEETAIDEPLLENCRSIG